MSGKGKPARLTAAQAIRKHCLECCAGRWSEVERCVCPDCALWPWRFGKRPETARAAGKLVDREAYEEAEG